MLLNIMNSLGDQRSIIITVFAYAVILLIAIPIHECAHCFAAYLLGDDTGLYSGRITLNPIRHWDLWGTIGMLTVGLGWQARTRKPRQSKKGFRKNVHGTDCGGRTFIQCYTLIHFRTYRKACMVLLRCFKSRCCSICLLRF